MGTKSRMTEAEDRIGEVKHRMLEIYEEERKKKKKKNKNKQSCINYKENTGTKLITNTKKHKLKIQSRVWSFRNTIVKKR